MAPGRSTPSRSRSVSADRLGAAAFWRPLRRAPEVSMSARRHVMTVAAPGARLGAACPLRPSVPNSTSAIARTGCAPRCSAPTTASSRPRAWSSAWRRPAPRVRRSSPPGSPGWWPGRCRWPPASTCRSARSATPSRPTSAWRSASSPRPSTASCASSPASTSSVGCARARRPGGPGAVARRRAGGARPRRAGPCRGAARAAAPGRVGFGAVLLGRRGAPAARRRGDAGGGAGPSPSR